MQKMTADFKLDREKLALLFAIVVFQCTAVAASEPRPADASAPKPAFEPVMLIDESGHAMQVTPEDLAKLARHTVEVDYHDKKTEFAGVALADLLEAKGIGLGDSLRGRGAPTVAVFEATDGYRVAVSLIEIDPVTSSTRPALFVDQRDREPLDAGEAPYRLVLPDDKRPIRWIRMIKTIRILNLQDTPLSDDAADSSPQ